VKLNRPYNFRRPTDATPKTWFRITNMAADTTEVALYDEIGMWGVTASDFMAELMNITAKNMTLRINSPGGDVFDGLAILNCLRSHKAQVNVVVDGLAASAASFIAMAGDTVEMAPNAMMMIHEASGLCMGNSVDMRELADLLDKTSGNIAAIYASRSGRSAEEHRTAMRAETWYSDQEAVDAGLADAVIGSEAKATNLSAVKITAPALPTWDDVFADVDLDSVANALKGVTA
jgi:ATP-dependent Clp endopeptidase proteolytic subunit ClpP